MPFAAASRNRGLTREARPLRGQGTGVKVLKLRSWAGASALAMTLLVPTPAAAGEKQDFEACDGRIHPARADDGMRGEPSSSSFGRPFPASAKLTIAACDRALASARLLPTQTLRRAHLLRARAAARLKDGDHAGALADLQLAEAATADRAHDRFHKRSMGTSLHLLRGVAHAQAGNNPQAIVEAQAAMAERPYSIQVQQLGAEIIHAAGGTEALAQSPWTMAMRLDPKAATAVLLRQGQAGNFARVLQLRPAVAIEWPKEAPGTYALLTASAGGTNLMGALLVSFHTAYAHAATGEPAKAKAELADIRARLQALQPATAAKPSGMGGSLLDIIAKGVDSKARQVEARIAVAEGRYSDAIAAMVGTELPKDAASAELLAAFKASAPAKDAALIPAASTLQVDPARTSREILGQLVSQALIAPETPRAVIDYDKSRPNIAQALIGGALTMGFGLLGGIERTDGFRSTPNADGTTKVEFIGNTPSAALVQEMTLLRAAELARAAGKPAFLIVDRKDYQRMLQMSRGGVPISSTPQGFKSELTIRFLDKAEGEPRALDAMAVIDALGPLYYEEKRKG